MARRFIILAAAALAASACNFGAKAQDRDAGSTVLRSYPVGAFDKIKVAGPYEVVVTTGGRPSVSARGGEKLLDQTEVRVDGDTLKIGPKTRKGFRWNWGRKGKARFTVTTAMLHEAVIAGSGDISVDKVAGDFKGAVAGSGDLRVGAINGGAIKLTIAGSGDITASGKAESAEIKIAGSGDIDAAGLAARSAEVSIAGSGNVKANASDTATIKTAGSGNVALTGGAKCTVSKTGSSNVTCR